MIITLNIPTSLVDGAFKAFLQAGATEEEAQELVDGLMAWGVKDRLRKARSDCEIVEKYLKDYRGES